MEKIPEGILAIIETYKDYEKQLAEKDKALSDAKKEIEDKDNFAIAFACWCMYDPYAKEIQASGATAMELLRRYKDRPYINPDSSQQ